MICIQNLSYKIHKVMLFEFQVKFHVYLFKWYNINASKMSI